MNRGGCGPVVAAGGRRARPEKRKAQHGGGAGPEKGMDVGRGEDTGSGGAGMGTDVHVWIHGGNADVCWWAHAKPRGRRGGIKAHIRVMDFGRCVEAGGAPISYWGISDMASRSSAGSMTADEVVRVTVGGAAVPLPWATGVVVVVSVTWRPVPLHLLLLAVGQQLK